MTPLHWQNPWEDEDSQSTLFWYNQARFTLKKGFARSMPIPKIEQPAATPIHQDEASTFQTGRVLAVTSGHLTHDLFPAFLSPLLPLLIEKLSMTGAAAGALMLFMQGPSLIQPFVGRLADRVNLKFVVILAPAITATAMSLVGVAPTYTWLALFLTIVGVSSAIFHSVGPALAGSFSGNRLGTGMSIWMVGGEIGRMMGPLVIVGVVSSLTLEGSVWTMLAGWLASLVLYVLLRNLPITLPAADGVEDWQTALRDMSSIMLPVILLVVARALLMNALQVFLPTYMTEVGAGLWMAGAAATIFAGATVLGTLLGGSLSDRLGRRQMLLISVITTPLLVLAFMRSEGLVLRMLLLFGAGLMIGPATPVILAIVQERFPEKRAFASGIYIAASFVIRSLASVLLGALGDWFGLGAAFSISAFVLFLGIPVVLMLPGKQDLEQDGSPA
ncbi:MAG: MFS transporter [Anaerolineaceae bacterium]|jgi:FSR family fosmidomycin resistance protein-like MFS transporter|nr:MFS transporter [Anaerolineaceae bacterium]